jgi:hypothetical protein
VPRLDGDASHGWHKQDPPDHGLVGPISPMAHVSDYATAVMAVKTRLPPRSLRPAWDSA